MPVDPQSGDLDVSFSQLGSYKCPQSLGKAISRVKKVLPYSPLKKTAIIRKLIYENLPTKMARQIFSEDKKVSNHMIPENHLLRIENFFKSDEVSRQARQTVSYTHLDVYKRQHIHCEAFQMTTIHF